MRLNSDDIKWDSGYLVYKGVKLHLTMENLQDYRFQTGNDPSELVISFYENSIPFQREIKLNQILND